MADTKVRLPATLKLFFFGSLFITVFAFVACLYIASLDTQNELHKSLFEACETVWKMGCGAIFALINTKAVEVARTE